MSIFNFGKPKWFRKLPSYLSLQEADIPDLEIFKTRYSINDNTFAMMISMTPWSVKKLQLYTLDKFKRENPFLPQKELWKAVIQSKMNVKLLTLETPPPFFVKPLSRSEINLIINSLDEISTKFKSFDDVIRFLIEIDDREGWFTDPSGITEELNELLKNSSKKLYQNNICPECDNPINRNDKFCRNCGVKLEWTTNENGFRNTTSSLNRNRIETDYICSDCRTFVEEADKFCKNCGADLR